MVPNPTICSCTSNEDYRDARPEPTGRVYITMESNVTGKTHLFVKQYKTTGGWLHINNDDIHENLSSCHAFSKQGAKNIIKRLQEQDYKVNYEKGLVKFGTLPEYEY